MRNIILMLTLTLLSSNAMAEWVEFHTNTSGNATNYADFSIVRKEGDKVKIWILTDFKPAMELNGVTIMSIKSQQQIDCKK